MRPLIPFITLLLLSCNAHEDRSAQRTMTDSSVSSSNALSADSITAMKQAPDSNIYQSYIPFELRSWIKAEIPNAAIPSPLRWDNYWFTHYKKENSLVNYVTADFNCDGKKDHSLILSEKGQIVLYTFMATDKGYKKEKLEVYGKDNGEAIEIGLELLKPGTYEYLEGDKEPPPANIKCTAIQLVYFEKAAVTYYWDRGKFRSIQTGD
jgi:hypothetical protein